MVLDETLKETQERWGIRCAAGISPDGSYSAALFTVPSGVYYWYWGKDQNGEICCLVADFFTYLSIKKSISKRRPRLSRGAAYPSLKLNRTSYMIGGSRKEKRGMFFRVFLYGFLYQGGHAGKERT